MLHEFLDSHRCELILRCKGKAADRASRHSTHAAIDGGVAVFLQHVAKVLQREAPSRAVGEENTFTAVPIGRDATRHAMESLRRGFCIEDVVREYGDICQATTELAIELNARITVDEFRIFNRCLDEAVAGAVAPYSNRLMSTIC